MGSALPCSTSPIRRAQTRCSTPSRCVAIVGIDFGRERVLDATTLLRFRRLVEKHALGMKPDTGTIVDATPIGAPSSTKKADEARDSEMHQTRKGQQWCFGINLHIGVDSASGLTHRAVVTAASVHDKHPLPELLHGKDREVWGDCVYASQGDLIASKAPRAGPDQPARAQGQRERGVGAPAQPHQVESASAGEATKCTTA